MLHVLPDFPQLSNSSVSAGHAISHSLFSDLYSPYAYFVLPDSKVREKKTTEEKVTNFIDKLWQRLKLPAKAKAKGEPEQYWFLNCALCGNAH